MSLCDSHSGFLWLRLALSGSYWLSMALAVSTPVSLWLSLALCDSHSGSHWLSLPLSGLLWSSLAHYCSLISVIQSLIGSQGPCSALSAAATLTHFILVCLSSTMRLCVFVLVFAFQTVHFRVGPDFNHSKIREDILSSQFPIWVTWLSASALVH